jgi:hypothetical protein
MPNSQRRQSISRTSLPYEPKDTLFVEAVPVFDGIGSQHYKKHGGGNFWNLFPSRRQKARQSELLPLLFNLPVLIDSLPLRWKRILETGNPSSTCTWRVCTFIHHHNYRSRNLVTYQLKEWQWRRSGLCNRRSKPADWSHIWVIRLLVCTKTTKLTEIQISVPSHSASSTL